MKIILIIFFVGSCSARFDHLRRKMFHKHHLAQKVATKNTSRFSQAAARWIVTDHADKRARDLHILLDGLALRIRSLADSPSKVLKQQKMKQVRDRDIDGLFMDIHDAGGLEEITDVLATLENLFDGLQIN